MIKKLFLILTAFAVQSFAPHLEVHGIGGNTINVEFPSGATIAEVCAQISATAEIHPNLTKVLNGTKTLNPRSTDLFPGEVSSVGLVELVPDCMVEINDKKMIITSERFPDGAEMTHSLTFSSKIEQYHELVGPGLPKNLIPRLSVLNEGEPLNFFEHGHVLSFSTHCSPAFESWLYFNIAYTEWFDQNIDPDKIPLRWNGKSLFFRDYLRCLVKSLAYPELQGIREKIHSRALERFSDETPKVLVLNDTKRDDRSIHDLRELGLIPA